MIVAQTIEDAPTAGASRRTAHICSAIVAVPLAKTTRRNIRRLGYCSGYRWPCRHLTELEHVLIEVAERIGRQHSCSVMAELRVRRAGRDVVGVQYLVGALRMPQ